jgi:hypothetical protein
MTIGGWYRVQLTWTPTSGTNGTLAFTLTRVSTSAVEATFSQPVTMNSTVNFGFGCYNDVGIFDNIVVDGTALVPTVTAVNDTAEVGIGGAIAFDPTVNDTTNTGTIDRSSITISPPSRGTATLDSLTGNMVYDRPTARRRERYLSAGGEHHGVTGTATVAVTISSAMRLANKTASCPHAACGGAWNDHASGRRSIPPWNGSGAGLADPVGRCLDHGSAWMFRTRPHSGEEGAFNVTTLCHVAVHPRTAFMVSSAIELR